VTLWEAARGDRAALRDCSLALTRDPCPTGHLIGQALRHVGNPSTRAALDGYLESAPLRHHIRLDLQEYRAPLPDDVEFDRSIRSVLSTCGFGEQHARDLASPRGAAAARALLADLESVARQAVGLTRLVADVTARVEEGLHLVRALALVRACQVTSSWRGLRVLEVGCRDDALLSRLEAQGAEVTGLDLEPRRGSRVTQGDFMTTPLLGQYDIVIATAVLEPGAGFMHLVRTGTGVFPLLARLRDLLVPGGHFVTENLGFPLPFSAQEARCHGLHPVDARTPVKTAWESSRGCTLRREDPEGRGTR
jgi:SAM-dependent methyltransferase